jgi:AAA family ATP:ADP antiporter
LRLLGDVRPGEGTDVLLLGLNCFVALVAYYVLKVAREPLILNTGGAAAKSYAAAVQAGCLMLLVPLHAALLRRVEPARLVRRVVVFFLLCIVLFELGTRFAIPYLGFVFFVWVGIFSLAIVSQFWSFTNDLYDTATGERLFPIIALGTAAGSIFGAFLARQLLHAGLGARSLLQVAGVLLIVHIALYGVLLRRRDAIRALRVHAAEPEREALGTQAKNGLALVLASPYLRGIAVLLVVLNLVNTLGEFVLSSGVKAEAERAFAAAAAATPGLARDLFLDTFVGTFYAELFTLVNIATLLLQSLLASRLVARFGIGGVLFALPIVAGGAYGLIAAGAGLAAVRFAKAAENSTDYSMMNTARAMLWLPTTRLEKYAAKQTVDTFFVRLGDLLAAAVVWGGTTWLVSQVAGGADDQTLARAFSGVNLGLILLWLWLANDLRKRYQRLAEPPLSAAANSE